MKINWTVRLRNRTFLASLLALTIAFGYDVLALLGIVPGVEESAVVSLCNTVLTILTALGVIMDPTTKGIGDSERAMTYSEPV